MEPNQTTLVVPRGTPNLDPIKLVMSEIYSIEARIPEVRFVNEVTGIELAGSFNHAISITGRYLSLIEYEILQADKYLNEAKSDVIIDKTPDEAKRLKDLGIKMSEDIREALVYRDPTYQKRLDILNGLKATKMLLKEKHDAFKRAYYSCDSKVNGARTFGGKKINGSVGMLTEPQGNMMGENQLDASVLEIYGKK